MQFEVVFVILFSAATAVGLLTRWLQIPYTVALVVTGLFLGAVRAIEPPHLTKELLFSVFLPGLVFEAAFHLDFQKFWQNKVSINVLAVPGVAAAIVLTAVVLHSVASAVHLSAGFGLQHALVFSALISATDPISVVALFKSLRVPRRLALLIEAESLLNDGTAVVFFTIVLGLMSGASSSIGGAFLDFLLVVGMGAAFGVALGYALSKLAQRTEDPMIQITLTTIAAYGSFTAAEHFHFSGIIATVAAGMICGNYGARFGMTPSARIAVQSFWEYVSFALNSVVFLLIGFEVRVQSLLVAWKPILLAYLAVTIGRAVVVYLVALGLRRTREAMPWSWSAVLTWGGLRGGLSMVLALALPKDFPFRDLLLAMTFGVVVLSILLQGLSMAPLLRRLKLVGSRAESLDYEHERGRVRAKAAALGKVDELIGDGSLNSQVGEALKQEYGRALADAEQRIKDMQLQAAELQAEEEQAARRQLLLVEKDALLTAYHKGRMSQEALDRLLADVDARLYSLETDHS